MMMKKISIILMGAILLTMIIIALSCGNVATQTITKQFEWTAPDADGGDPYPNPHGRACDQYDFRFALDSMTLINDWNNCDGGVLTDIPSSPGVKDTVDVMGFNPSSEYFCAVKAGDQGQWGEISNIVVVTTEDLSNPAKIIDLDEVSE